MQDTIINPPTPILEWSIEILKESIAGDTKVPQCVISFTDKLVLHTPKYLIFSYNI